jgi:hypothetical protein
VTQNKETRFFTSAVKIYFPQLNYNQENVSDSEIEIFRYESKKLAREAMYEKA